MSDWVYYLFIYEGGAPHQGLQTFRSEVVCGFTW